MKIRLATIVAVGALMGCVSLQAYTTGNSLYLSSSTPAGFTPGPYSGTLNGVSVEIYCDDAIDTAPIGGTWTVNSNTLTNATDITSDTRFGVQTINQTSTTYFPAGTTQAQVPTGTVLYEELAWLFTQLAAQTNATVEQGIQQAAWDLTSNGPSDNPGATSDLADAKTWIAAAVTDYNKTSGAAVVTVDSTTVSVLYPTYANWMVFTPPSAVNDPTGGSGNQEFLAYYSSNGSGGKSSTPEPATSGLLGMGLIACGFFARRRANSKKSESI